MLLAVLDVLGTHQHNPNCPMRIAQHPGGYWYCVDCGYAIEVMRIPVMEEKSVESVKSVKPLYEHDCDTCEFIKTINVEGTFYDVYRCTITVVGESTWLARYDDAGGSYWSMPWDVMKTADRTQGTPLMREMFSIANAWEEAGKQ